MAKNNPQLKGPPARKALEPPSKSHQRHSEEKSAEVKRDISPDREMVKTIDGLKQGLRDYEIRQLVKHSESLGKHLVKQGLKTNQVRKFLDAVKRLKVELSQDEEENFSTIEDEVVLLKPKLAYAAARQETKFGNPVKPLADVMSAAIDKVKGTPDFYRLVQLIESIIAYHKAAGGTN